MVKLKSPLLSFGAHGSVGDALTYQRIHHTDIVRSKPFPTDPRSFPQLAHRFIYWDIVQMWHELSVAEKRQYEIDARRRRITAFNFFMSEELDLASHLLLYLPMDETSGSLARDFSPLYHDFTIFGAQHVDGVYDYGLLLDGLDDRLTRSPSPSYSGMPQLTIEFAATRTAPKQTGFILEFYRIATLVSVVRIQPGDDFQWYIGTDDGVFLFAPAPSLPDLGVNYRCSLSYDGSLMRIVINGTDYSTFPATGNLRSEPLADFIIGNRSVFDIAHRGILDDFRYYDVALTLTQQQRHTERTPR